jgi:hypothetical protein
MDQEAPSRRRWISRAGLPVAVGAAVLVSSAVTFAAVRTHEADEPTETGSPNATAGPGDGEGTHEHEPAASDEELIAATADGRDLFDHPTLPPYEDRYAAASDEEQAAADDLRSEVQATVEPYQDVAAAVAAGYQPPGRPRGPFQHYLNLDLVRDSTALDPARPDGLVFYFGGQGDPVLLGAFFVARREMVAPRPAGDLVVWHSHESEACPGVFATDAEPCTHARRMLHVWTVDQVELVGRRAGRTVPVEVTDPFGAPFRAAVERAS